jgi:phosphoribosylformylglycinamidine cyclo-ligase
LDLPEGGATYDSSGVSIVAGDEFVRSIGPLVESTARPGVLDGIGGFGGLFHLGAAGRFRDPVLVASADGVGTKLEVARLVGRYDTVGLDLVAMLVDDLVCLGAEPLFLLDYVAVGRVDEARLVELMRGITEGCRLAGCALLGGETAEHGGVMASDDLDVAGFAVGVLERDEELGRARVRVGDQLIGLASPGLRSNGYSLARRVLVDGGNLSAPAYPGASRTLGEELLLPSVIYTPGVLRLRHVVGGDLHAAAHITGGGILGNVARILPERTDARIDLESFATPEIFFEIQRRGSVSAREMLRVFNCGLGMVLAVSSSRASEALNVLRESGFESHVIGEIVEGSREVRV